MRILQVIEPGIDGVFRHVEGLVDFLLNRQHEVALAYSDVRGSDRLGELVGRVKARGGKVLNLGVSNVPHVTDAVAGWHLWRAVSGWKPDVIHSHSSKAGGLARLLAFVGVKTPQVYTPNAYFGMSGQRGPKALLFNSVERALGSWSHTVNVSNDEALFAAEQLKVDRSHRSVIPNPVDTERFHPPSAEDRRQARRLFGLSDDALVLGSAGRFSFQKDPETLYKAMGLALKRNPNLYLLHLGMGELASRLESLAAQSGIADRIIRRPYLADPLPFYHAVDGLILTSRYEGLSFAVLEALSVNLPLILSDVPGNRDFLHLPLSHAIGARAEDPASFADAIGAWTEACRHGGSPNHRSIAIERFGLEHCYGQVVQLYEQLLRRSHPAAG